MGRPGRGGNPGPPGPPGPPTLYIWRNTAEEWAYFQVITSHSHFCICYFSSRQLSGVTIMKHRFISTSVYRLKKGKMYLCVRINLQENRRMVKNEICVLQQDINPKYKASFSMMFSLSLQNYCYKWHLAKLDQKYWSNSAIWQNFTIVWTVHSYSAFSLMS